MVPPTIVRHPSQSMAFRPAHNEVLGVSMSKRKRMITKAIASKGTAKS